MNPEQYEKVSALFAAALREEPDGREAFVQSQAGDDPKILREVQGMLAEHASAASPLDHTPLGGLGMQGLLAEEDLGDSGLVGAQLGPFRLTGVLASGGMGTVYTGEQDHPHRTVAVKVMRQGLTTASALRRFEMESEVLARLQHPGIAQVLEAGVHQVEGTTEKRPWFAMELVPGAQTLTDFVAHNNLGSQERLNLFRRICEAVHHGHQKGVIHRDLKPANILVDERGQPKIIDFGVARSTDADVALTTLHTHVGQLIGTLQYMSPEQCAADPDDLDLRSDVYALGVVLYELMCERLPYDVSKVAVHEAVRVIQESPPERPSAINRRLGGDVETITLKALEKERERRYGSVQDLAEDVRRFLEHEPISARPPSAMYQLRKLARRHRGLAAGAMVAVVALVAGTTVATWQALVARGAERTSDDALKVAEIRVEGLEAVNRFLHDVLAGAHPENARGRDVTIREALNRAAQLVDEEEEMPPLVEGQIRFSVGNTLQGLGLWEEAFPHLERAYLLWEKHGRKDDPDTLAAGDRYARALEHAGERKKAEDLLRLILKRREASLGPKHDQTLESINNLALFLHKQPEYLDEAEELAKKALRLRKEVSGETDNATLTAANNLALVYSAQGHNQKALDLLTDIMEIQRRTDPEHPNFFKTLANVASMLRELERYHDAEAPLLEAIAVGEKLLPEDRRNIYQRYREYGILLQQQGRFEEAGPWFVKALEAAERDFGPDHESSIGAANGYGVFLQKAGDPHAAQPYLERAVEAALRNKRPDDPEPFDYQANLGWNRVLLKDYDGAEELLYPALEAAWKVHGPDHLDALRIQALWADLLERQGDLDAATTQFEEVLAGREARLAPEHSLVLEAMHNLALLYTKTEKWEESRDLYLKVLDADRRKDPDGEYTRKSLENVASTYCSLGLHAKEIPYLEEALGISERKEGESAPATQELRKWLHNTLDTVQASAATGPTRKALIIGVDGLRPDQLALAETPHIDQWFADAWSIAGATNAWTADAPFNGHSATNWGVLLTGISPTRTDLTQNDDPVDFISDGAEAGDGSFRTLFGHLKAHDKSIQTAVCNTWGGIGMAAGTILADSASVVDVHFRLEGDSTPAQRDAATVKATAAILAQRDEYAGVDADVIFLHVDQADGAGHEYAYDSDGYRKALVSMDALLNQLKVALDSRPARADEEWLVILTSDHGGPSGGTGHGDNGDLHTRTIPFLVRADGLTPAMAPAQATLYDVTPTVLAWMGVPFEAAAFDGRALLPPRVTEH